ncbi:MAG TPA: hypothetical protein VKI44_34890 [Acetobacteraceae bacterium]|nr:hypothetical protein [Acetobacteraceae bacterium]
MTDAPSAASFIPHIGQTVSLPDGHMLTLVAVDQRNAYAPEAATRAPFSLKLRGPPAPIVPEGMHRLVFEDGTGFELYLIPVHTRSRDHQDYQIVFN